MGSTFISPFKHNLHISFLMFLLKMIHWLSSCQWKSLFKSFLGTVSLACNFIFSTNNILDTALGCRKEHHCPCTPIAQVNEPWHQCT